MTSREKEQAARAIIVSLPDQIRELLGDQAGTYDVQDVLYYIALSLADSHEICDRFVDDVYDF